MLNFFVKSIKLPNNRIAKLYFESQILITILLMILIFLNLSEKNQDFYFSVSHLLRQIIVIVEEKKIIFLTKIPTLSRTKNRQRNQIFNSE